MYDELIGRLRVNGELFQKYIPNAEGEILLQAADAIEELSAIREEQKAQIIAMAAEGKPCWIPVEERLPEERQFVLAWKDEKPNGFACVSFWMDNAGWAFKNITHWMPLPEPPKEET